MQQTTETACPSNPVDVGIGHPAAQHEGHWACTRERHTRNERCNSLELPRGLQAGQAGGSHLHQGGNAVLAAAGGIAPVRAQHQLHHNLHARRGSQMPAQCNLHGRHLQWDTDSSIG